MFRRAHGGKDHPAVARSMNNLAKTLVDLGRFAEAEPLRREARDARRRRAELPLARPPADPKNRGGRDAELETLARRVADLDAALRPLLPAVGRLDKLDAATPDDLRTALPPGASFFDLLADTRIEFDPQEPGKAGETRTPSYTAFVVTRGGVTWVDLGPAAPVEKAVGAWRQAITAPPPAAPDLPATVRRLVWEPVRKALPADTKTVYISPDAALARLPWAALPGDTPGTS